jgi:hypothetical protein
MKSSITWSARVIVIALALAGAAQAHSLKGLWDGTVKYDDYKIPFLIQFSQKGDTVSAAFFNGDEQVTSTGGRLDKDALNVNFDHYATRPQQPTQTVSSKVPTATPNMVFMISKPVRM